MPTGSLVSPITAVFISQVVSHLPLLLFLGWALRFASQRRDSRPDAHRLVRRGLLLLLADVGVDVAKKTYGASQVLSGAADSLVASGLVGILLNTALLLAGLYCLLQASFVVSKPR